MASSRGMPGADYCISGGHLTRHTGCQWMPGASLDRAKYKPKHARNAAYLYAGPDAAYLLRVKDTFCDRRGSATGMVGEGTLEEMWPVFIAYGRMTT